MRTICCGWVELAGKLHPCGKLIVEGDESEVDSSHGLCEECNAQWARDFERLEATMKGNQ